MRPWASCRYVPQLLLRRVYPHADTPALSRLLPLSRLSLPPRHCARHWPPLRVARLPLI